MTPPPLTKTARQEALLKALALRRERAELLDEIRSGRGSLTTVLERDDEIAGRIPTRRLLEALPGIGKIRSLKIMKELGIAESRRVQGLGHRQRQRQRLLELFPPHTEQAPRRHTAEPGRPVALSNPPPHSIAPTPCTAARGQ
ncbi:integration host factor, actinobacterial type [Streptomyces sp. NPDC056534]|uniref:integration host factor, actinobacterial type n=1 Tax=Streptomyces sp. NPDC056534 TaxID=3345857 RepID=UPI003679C914